LQQQDTCTRIKGDTTKADESLKEINDYHGFVYFVLRQLMQKLSAFMKSVMHQDTSVMKNCKGKKRKENIENIENTLVHYDGVVLPVQAVAFFFLLQSARQEPEK
jgi:regulator of PEP synthase PpsR (kinase-PPPase family)